MSSKSTYLEQDLVNILASMTLKIADYPSVFYETGYRVEYIEKEFDLLIEGQTQEVKFDIVLNNILENHSLPCECKSGGADPKQLLKYSQIKPEDLVNVGGVSSNDPSMHTHDITVVFNDINKEKINKDTAPFRFVQLAVSKDPTRIVMDGTPFQDDNLEQYFNKPTDYPNHVFEVFRINDQTPLAKYVKIIATELVAFSRNGKEKFTLEELAPVVTSSIPEFYPSRIGARMRMGIEKKIGQALQEGSCCELRDFFKWNAATKKGVLCKIKPGCKSASYFSFKEAAFEMADRLRKGEPTPAKYLSKKERTSPGQIPLITISDSGDEKIME